MHVSHIPSSCQAPCCPNCVQDPPFLLATKQCWEYKLLLLSRVCESPKSGIQSRPILSNRCPNVVQAATKPLISDQALAKHCPSCDQAPLISDQARPSTVLGVYVFVYFRGSAIPPKLPFYNIKRGNHLWKTLRPCQGVLEFY